MCLLFFQSNSFKFNLRITNFFHFYLIKYAFRSRRELSNIIDPKVLFSNGAVFRHTASVVIVQCEFLWMLTYSSMLRVAEKKTRTLTQQKNEENFMLKLHPIVYSALSVCLSLAHNTFFSLPLFVCTFFSNMCIPNP